MHLLNRLYSAVMALVLGCLSLDAMACSTDAWDAVSGGVPGSPSAISRYSGLCAFAVSGAGYVQSERASDQRYIARFYVLNGIEGSEAVVIFRAYSDDAATSALFEISLNGSQFEINAASAGGGFATAAAKSGWNLVEVDWASGGSMSYWINADSQSQPATGTIDSAGSGTVQAVRLGAPDGLGGNSGTLTFDAFESHRSTPVGALLVGDADGDGAITEADIGAIRQEFFENGLSIGTPDCNADGKVNSGDAVCVVNEGLGG
jgi:hypothetical protein